MRQDALAAGLQGLGKNRADLIRDRKSKPWKIALASALKWRTTATNRWLGENLKFGALHKVSRKMVAGIGSRIPSRTETAIYHKPQSLTRMALS